MSSGTNRPGLMLGTMGETICNGRYITAQKCLFKQLCQTYIHLYILYTFLII